MKAPNDRKKQAIFRLWPYMRPHLGRMGMALFLSIPMAAIKISPAPAVKYLTDTILVQKDHRALLLLPIGIVALFALNFGIRFFHYYLIRTAATQVVQTIRNGMYNHLLRLSLGYFTDAQGGSLLSRVVNDVQNIIQGIQSFIHLVREPIIFLSLLGYAVYLNWRLALLTMVMIPLTAILLANTGKHSKRYASKIQQSFGDLSSLLSESFIGMRVIQSFNLEGFMRGQFMQRNRELSRTTLKAARVEEMAAPGVEFISGIAVALVLYFGGREVLAGHMSPGDVFAFFTCFGLMVQPLRMFNDLNLKMNQMSASAERIFQLLDTEPEITDGPNAKNCPDFSRAIEFKNVNFHYRNGRSVLENFNFTLHKGEVVAIVGASGAGKSTLLSLLPRFYDPDAGQVFIDGIDIREYKVASLRRQISLVTQEVFLFHDTVSTNIRAGLHQASEEKIIAAAKAAQAFEYIQKLQYGFQTVIGDRGQKLSGGERQRLSIARAILKDAPILLLDEATSALDSENERLVQVALDRLLEGRTAVVVAHRLSTIRKAHRILVMEKGQIVEMGTHEELIAKNGAYARALALQEGFSMESREAKA